MDRSVEREISRRDVLALAGAVPLAGCSVPLTTGGGSRCGPASFDPGESAWAFPNYDVRHTRAAPAGSTPPWELTEQWHEPLTDVAFDHRPVVADGTVYVATGGITSSPGPTTYHALALEDGAERWTVDAPGWPQSIALDGRFFVAGPDVAAVDAEDGERLWNRTSLVPPIAADGGLVTVEVLPEHAYEGGRRTPRPTAVRAASVDDDEECWSTEVDLVPYVRTMPAVTDERIVFATSDEVVALRRDDHAVDWRTPATGNPECAPVVVGEDGVLVSRHAGVDDDGTSVGQLRLLDLDGGEERWSRELPGRRAPGVATTGDRVFVGESPAGSASGRLTARDPASGEVVWARDGGEIDWAPDDDVDVVPGFLPALVVVGDHCGVYAKSGEAERVALLWFDAADGTERGALELDHGVNDVPAFADDRLVVLSVDGPVVYG